MSNLDLGFYYSFTPDELTPDQLTLTPSDINRLLIRTVVCLYDANRAHHKNNLRISNEGVRTEEVGCNRCFVNYLTPLVLTGGQSQFAAAWRALTPEERGNRVETAESQHKASTDDIATMNDMKNEIEQGGKTWGNQWQADKTYPVTSVEDVINKLQTAYDLHGTINVLACVMHGVPNQFSLGGTIRDGAVPSAEGLSVTAFVERIKNYLAEDILWILYACGTAGLGLGNGEERNGGHARLGLEITRGQEGGRHTVAAALHDALHAKGKVRATVWGHTGYGVATQRPYWRRYRDPGAHAVSLFEMCFNEAFVNDEYIRLGPHSPWNSANAVRAEMFGASQFRLILIEALREMNAGTQGVRDIPLWSLVFADPERTRLPERCQAIWKRRHQRR